VCERIFLFSHSRPPSLLYDPNTLLCVLGSVPDSGCVSGSAGTMVQRTFNVAKSDFFRVVDGELSGACGCAEVVVDV